MLPSSFYSHLTEPYSPASESVKACSKKPDSLKVCYPKADSPKASSPKPDSPKGSSPKPDFLKVCSPDQDLDLESQLQFCLDLITKTREQICQNEKHLVRLFEKSCTVGSKEEEEITQLEIVKLDIQNELLKQGLDFEMDQAEVLTQKLGYFDQEDPSPSCQFQKVLVQDSETKVNMG